MPFDENAPIQLHRFPLPPGTQPKMKHTGSTSHLTGSIRGPSLRPSSTFDPNVSLVSIPDVSLSMSVLDKDSHIRNKMESSESKDSKDSKEGKEGKEVRMLRNKLGKLEGERKKDVIEFKHKFEMVDLTLADLKAEIAILKSSAARDMSTTIASPFAPSHKHHPTPYGTTTTPAKPKCAAHSTVDSPPVPALQARLKRQSVSNAEGLEGAFGDDTEVTVLSGSVEELSEDAVREEDRSAREILLDDFLTPKNEDISSVEMTTTATQDIESSSNKLSALEQMVLEQNHLIIALQSRVAEIVAQQESHKPASVPIDDHDSEIDFARLFARTIADKERLQSENAMLLEENSRLKTRVEELEVASMLQIQPEDTPSKYYTPMSPPEATSRFVHIENKHLTSVHRKISARKASDRFLSAPQLPPLAPASPFVMKQ